jgi:hypothetical protein
MSKLGNIAGLAALVCLPQAFAQKTPVATTHVPIVITAGHYYGNQPPVLTMDDLTVMEYRGAAKVTNLVPLRGEHAALELFLLVDNCSDCALDSKLAELRRFIASQPASTSIGIAYIRNGQLDVVETPTRNREDAMKALGVAAAGNPSSPFGVLTDLITGWQEGSSRRAVLMVSSGVEPNGKQDQSPEKAIEAAQRAGVTVYAIYQPSAAYLNNARSGTREGQTELAHVALETRGEAYFLNLGPLPSLAPFLTDLSGHLANQYLLEFLANPGDLPGTLQQVTIESRFPDLEIVAPYRALIPEASHGDRP